MKSSAKVLTFLLVMAPGFAQADDAVEKVDTVAKKCGENCPGHVLNGFSVGLDLIYHMTEVKTQQSSATGTIPAYINGTFSTNAHYSANQKRYRFDPAINLGYSYFNKGFYAGLAGDVAFGDKKNQTVDFGGAEAKTKIEGISYGVKAKFGGYIRGIKSVVYAIAEVKWTDVTFQFKALNDLGTKAKLKLPSFVVGVGFDRLIRDKWSLTGEYEYSWRNSKDTSTYKPTGAEFDINVDQRLREHSLRIGVKYHI